MEWDPNERGSGCWVMGIKKGERLSLAERREGWSLNDTHSLYVCAPLSPLILFITFSLPAFIKWRICHLLPERCVTFCSSTAPLLWALASLWGQLQHSRCGFGGHKYPQRVPNLQCSCEERERKQRRRRVQEENVGQRSSWMQLLKCTAPESDHSVCCTVVDVTAIHNLVIVLWHSVKERVRSLYESCTIDENANLQIRQGANH